MSTSIRPSWRTVLVSVSTGAALILAGCGSAGDETATASGSDDRASAGYPVTVDTVYGEITLDEQPERIVAIGGGYVDQLAALGVQPTAYVGSPRAGDDILAGYPWLEDSGLDLDAYDVRLLAEGYVPSLEAVAAYEPDLILGQGADWSIDEELYEQISLIAPTYTTPYTTDEWPETLSDLGALTGTSDAASQLVADVETEISEARERLAGMQGATYLFADVRDQELFLNADIPLLDSLGLEPAAELAVAETLSLESLDQLTADVLYIMTWRQPDTQAVLEADPRYDALPAVAAGSVVYADATLTNALADTGPLGVSFWVERVTSQLEDSALSTGE